MLLVKTLQFMAENLWALLLLLLHAIVGFVSLLKQCAKKFEAQTGEDIKDILNVDILKEIFNTYQTMTRKFFDFLIFLIVWQTIRWY